MIHVIFWSVNLVLLAAWTAIAPLEWKREVTLYDEYSRPTSSFGQCTAMSSPFDDNDNPGMIFLICLALINVGVLGFALYQAYVARGISVEFAESEYILKALSAAMLVSLVGVPVMIIVTDEPAAFFFVLSRYVCLPVLVRFERCLFFRLHTGIHFTHIWLPLVAPHCLTLHRPNILALYLSFPVPCYCLCLCRKLFIMQRSERRKEGLRNQSCFLSSTGRGSRQLIINNNKSQVWRWMEHLRYLLCLATTKD